MELCENKKQLSLLSKKLTEVMPIFESFVEEYFKDEFFIKKFNLEYEVDGKSIYDASISISSNKISLGGSGDKFWSEQSLNGDGIHSLVHELVHLYTIEKGYFDSLDKLDFAYPLKEGHAEFCAYDIINKTNLGFLCADAAWYAQEQHKKYLKAAEETTEILKKTPFEDIPVNDSVDSPGQTSIFYRFFSRKKNHEEIEEILKNPSMDINDYL